MMPPTSRALSGRNCPSISPCQPWSMPSTVIPRSSALRVTARIAAFMPGASPPLVRTAICFMCPGSWSCARNYAIIVPDRQPNSATNEHGDDGRGGANTRQPPSIIPRSAVHMDRLACDEAAIVTDQEQTGRGDLLHLALAAQRNPRRVRRPALIPFRIVAPCIDAARRNDVHPDVVRRELAGQSASKAHQPHLRRRHMRPPAAADERALAGEEQDPPISVLHP